MTAILGSFGNHKNLNHWLLDLWLICMYRRNRFGKQTHWCVIQCPQHSRCCRRHGMGFGTAKGGTESGVYKCNHCTLCSGWEAPEGTETDSPRVSALILGNTGMQKLISTWPTVRTIRTINHIPILHHNRVLWTKFWLHHSNYLHMMPWHMPCVHSRNRWYSWDHDTLIAQHW